MKNVIFIAPPAAGKGTQSAELEKLGYEHISTGDMLRNEMKNKTDIGINIENIMKNGGLVSDDIVFNLIEKRLSNLNKPFILDGFPRTYNQVLLLDDLFNKLNINNYEVIYLDIDIEVAMKRALGRLTCECGASYNKFDDKYKPLVDGICNKCGKKLVLRTDDNEESFKNRFNKFLESIESIKDYYLSKNKLHYVDTTKEQKEIIDTIKEILK